MRNHSGTRPQPAVVTAFFIAALLCVTGGNVTSSALPALDTTESAPARGTGTARQIKISFYYDADLNGKKENAEPWLTNLMLATSGNSRADAGGTIMVPADTDMTLDIRGIGPRGKTLTTATFREPAAVVLLPRFTVHAGSADMALGLNDGFLTSPIRPSRLNMDDYEAAFKNPAAWKTASDPYYPAGWLFARTWYFYGYRIPSGGLQGTPHLAFDIQAVPGTPVRASMPGTITQPLFDWRLGISGPCGTVYYSHIVPAVKPGDSVARYDVIGSIASGEGNHVHLELRPEPAAILSAFPGCDRTYFLKSPLRGERVPLPPYFGP